MHYTYEELVKKYGLFYNIGSSYIEEVFGFEKEDYKKYYDNVLEAKNDLITKFKKEYEDSLKIINNEIKELENESWFYRFRNRKKIENYFNQKKTNLKYTFEKNMNVDVHYKSTSNYYSDMSKFFQNGDILYVAVTDVNTVEPGVYEAKISRVEYRMNNNKIDIRPSYIINHNEGEHYFTFTYDNGVLASGYAYHNLFENENEAINYLQNDLSNKIKKLDTMHNELEKKKLRI